MMHQAEYDETKYEHSRVYGRCDDIPPGFRRLGISMLELCISDLGQQLARCETMKKPELQDVYRAMYYTSARNWVEKADGGFRACCDWAGLDWRAVRDRLLRYTKQEWKKRPIDLPKFRKLNSKQVAADIRSKTTGSHRYGGLRHCAECRARYMQLSRNKKWSPAVYRGI